MKIWCESCKGKATQEGMFHCSKNMVISAVACTVCNGKGYVEDLELERLADIGKSTEVFINSHDCVMGIIRWVDPETEEEGTEATTIDCVDDLLVWAKEGTK